jgi:hypothetical protein
MDKRRILKRTVMSMASGVAIAGVFTALERGGVNAFVMNLIGCAVGTGACAIYDAVKDHKNHDNDDSECGNYEASRPDWLNDFEPEPECEEDLVDAEELDADYDEDEDEDA